MAILQTTPAESALSSDSHSNQVHDLEAFFKPFRENIIGTDAVLTSQYHIGIKMLYADWTASGRAYRPIEEKFINEILPLVANTHTETNHSGMAMTNLYHKAQAIIKAHVKANDNDVLILDGSGMTGAVNKFQRILGLKLNEDFSKRIKLEDSERPVVFITHMEHHSNQTSWLETIADVVIVPPTKNGLVSVAHFKNAFAEYPNRPRIASVTACSNVTGIETPFMEIAKAAHANDALCFVDFACSGPYVEINMHENDGSGKYLDAIFLSPHKFLGGPGTSGVLVFNKKLYHNSVPDAPGGGTVAWTNPWGERAYLDDIEAREDGGTPPFLQTIKIALAIKLKEQMGTANIRQREEELLAILWNKLDGIKGLTILAAQHKQRLGVVSFYIDGLHYNLAVKLLNDKFGIQTRGGCSCAGTYGHYLLEVDETYSHQITDEVDTGDFSHKPGWVRMSIHPTMSNTEVEFIADALLELVEKKEKFAADYTFNSKRAVAEPKNASADLALNAWVDENAFEL
jgi:selenocysteine lyase/cysteine desulfurase